MKGGFLAVLCLLAFAFTATQAGPKPTLRTAYVDFPPFKYTGESGNPRGPWVDMTRKVVREAGYRLEWVHLPIARVYLHLRSGQIDLWPGLAGVPELQGAVYETDATPMRLSLMAYHREGKPPVTSIEALRDEKLVLIQGFTYLGVLDRITEGHNRAEQARTHPSAIGMLLKARGDYLLNYEQPTETAAKAMGVSLQGSEIYAARGTFVISRKTPGAEQIVRELDAAYQRLLERGEIEPLDQ